MLSRVACLMPLALLASAQTQKYDGPRPPKPDLPYLVHADTLIPTETSTATEEDRRGDKAFVVQGASSTARTPLAEPIFLIRAEKIVPDKLQLYRLNTEKGRREVVMPRRPKKDSARPLRLMVTRLEPGLFKVEVNEGLENGEYSLSPMDSNDVFCFQVY